MKNLLYLLICTLIFISCGDDKKITTVTTEPSEQIIQNYNGKNIAVILDDMKIDEDKKTITYKHKYNVLKMIKDSLHQDKKTWENVNQSFFQKHKNDLGMEILSKHNGKISRVAQPVGLGWAVGNKKHGEWVTDKKNDSITNKPRKRWRTFGSSPFLWYWLGSRRFFSRNDYQSYQSHSANGKSYYGNKNTNGTYDYGTRSTHQKKARPSFFSRKKNNGSSWNRLSKSSSRYSKGSSTRSRSGGYGK